MSRESDFLSHQPKIQLQTSTELVTRPTDSRSAATNPDLGFVDRRQRASSLNYTSFKDYLGNIMSPSTPISHNRNTSINHATAYADDSVLTANTIESENNHQTPVMQVRDNSYQNIISSAGSRTLTNDRRRWRTGLLCLMTVVFLWVASSFLVGVRI